MGSISDFILVKQRRLSQVIEILQQRSGFEFHSEPSDGEDSPSPVGTPSESSHSRVRTWSTSHDGASQPTSPSGALDPLTKSITGSLLLSDRGSDSRPGTPAKRNGSLPSPISSRRSSPVRQYDFTGEPRPRHSNLSLSRDSARGRELSSATIQAAAAPVVSALGLDIPSHREAASNTIVQDYLSQLPSPQELDASDPFTQPRSFDDLSTTIPASSIGGVLMSKAASAHSQLDLASKISILPDELVCVGLNMEYESLWQDRLVRAFFYSDDVLPSIAPVSDVVELNFEPEGSPACSTEPLSNSTDLKSSRNRAHHPRPNLRSTSSALSMPQASPATIAAEQPVPFVSFTATEDGSSLTADIRLLRRLFPGKDDENMVYTIGDGGLTGSWTGEEEDDIMLEEVEVDVESFDDPPDERGRPIHPTARAYHQANDGFSDSWTKLTPLASSDASPRSVLGEERTLLKCLQLDLSSFGLGMHRLCPLFLLSEAFCQTRPAS